MSVPVVRKLFSWMSHSALGLLSSDRLAWIRRVFPAALKQQARSTLEKPLLNALKFHRTADWKPTLAMPTPIIPVRSVFPDADALGVNLYGYFSRWLGLGECARLYAHAMLASGYPVALHDVDINIPHSRYDYTLSSHMHTGGGSPYACDLVFVNPDHWEDTLLSIGTSGKRRYTIGYWFWELEKFPEAWLHALEKVDEIMVSTGFIEQAVREVSNKPVTRVPLPVMLGRDSGLQRSHFGLKGDDYIFFCSFDFNSTIARKNPYAVIDAFLKAFPEKNEKVALLIKTSNGDRYTPMLMRLLEAAASDIRIVVRDDMLTRHDLQSLHRCIDVYVSLHRCEGFGLGIAEAMCMGKPVVATAYSGNMEFMTAVNSCLVDYRLVAVKPGEYPHADGQRWAEPDIGHAARYFRRLYEDRIFAQSLGSQAAQDMARDFSVDACMRVLMRRLGAIGAEMELAS